MGHIVSGEVGSVEGLGKRVLENGGGSESGRRFSENGGEGIRQLNFKKRKVSAVRDFPSGCGPQVALVDGKSKEKCVAFAHPVEDATLELNGNGAADAPTDKDSALELKENGTAALVVKENGDVAHPAENAALDSKENGDVAHPAEEAALDSKENADSSVHETRRTTKDLTQAEASEPVVDALPQDDSVEPEKPVRLEVSDHVPLSVTVEPVTVAVGENTQKRRYPPRPKTSAVRDFPPGCGVNCASVNIEELQNSVDSSNDKSLVMKKSSEAVKKKQIEKADVKRVEEKARVGDALKSKAKETKENGGGVKRKLEGGATIENGGGVKRKLEGGATIENGGVVKRKLEGGVKKEMVEQKPSSSKKVDIGSGSSGGKVGTESVKLGKDMNYKRKFPENSINEGRAINQSRGKESVNLDSSDDRMVVQSLMAKQNCPWRHGKNGKPATGTPSKAGQGKKSFKSASGTPSQGEQGKKTLKSESGTPPQQVEQGKTTPKSVSGSPSPQVERGEKTLKLASGNQSQVAKVLGSESSDDREIVQSLMATRFCPWRNGKKTFKSPSGQAKKQAFVSR